MIVLKIIVAHLIQLVIINIMLLNKKKNLKSVKASVESLGAVLFFLRSLANVKFTKPSPTQPLEYYFSTGGINIKFSEIDYNEAIARGLAPDLLDCESYDCDTGEVSEYKLLFGWKDQNGKNAESILHIKTKSLIKSFFENLELSLKAILVFKFEIVKALKRLIDALPDNELETDNCDKKGNKTTLSPRLIPTPIATGR